jgi:transposase
VIPIQERNRQILQMRKTGVSQREVARIFSLSRSRIYLLERRDKADRSMAERRARLREEARLADDPEKMWPVEDLFDAAGLTVVAKKRLLAHFAKEGRGQISLRRLMDMCLDAPVQGRNYSSPPVLRVCGIGTYGFRLLVNGLTGMDLGSRCNEEWRGKLVQVKRD